MFPCVKGQLSSGRSVVVPSLRQKRTVMKDSRLRHYPVLCDPLATFASLRRAGLLDGYSYLHLSPEHTEIGWAPVERLALLSGTPCHDWRDQLAKFALRAELMGRKAFGYIGFDVVTKDGGTLPDRSETDRPLVEFVIPGETSHLHKSRRDASWPWRHRCFTLSRSHNQACAPESIGHASGSRERIL